MKAIIISIIVALVLIGGASIFTRSDNVRQVADVNNVSIVDGRQIVEISAKGGYQPKRSIAKAGVPTILRFDTEGTFDCSSVVRIPSMGISKVLPQSGTTDIDMGVGKSGLLQGSCGMGMYPFEIDFQSQ